MITDIPWVAFIAVFGAVAALFIVFKSFKMPSSFTENQHKRDELRKKNLPGLDEEKKAALSEEK